MFAVLMVGSVTSIAALTARALSGDAPRDATIVVLVAFTGAMLYLLERAQSSRR